MQNPHIFPATYIDSTLRLRACCERWSDQAFLALDTEFVRTNTFYPKLGLLQVADESDCYLIDPLLIDDWECLLRLFRSRDICFVLHSCGEDLNLFVSYFKQLPGRIFDTQIAAAFLGSGFSLSYQALVEQALDVQLPKSETRSDWLRRPLSATQLNYAAADVAYLPELRARQQSQLAERRLLPWFEMECARALKLAVQAEQTSTWQSMYTGISSAWHLDEPQLRRLQKLCIWREMEARTRDKPRNWIARDADLYCVAAELPQKETANIGQLRQLPLDKRLLNRYGKKMVAALADDGLAAEPVDRSRLILPLTTEQRAKLKASQRLVRDKADALGMAPEMLGRKRWLIELIQHRQRHDGLVESASGDEWRLRLLNPELDTILSDCPGL